MEDRVPRRRHARPVVDPAVQRLMDRGPTLAKGWLLELIDERPLERAQDLLAAGLARSGPLICAGIVGALESDRQLERLLPGGALEPLLAELAELVGARSSDEVCAALESLRGVIWSTLRGELSGADPELVWALAERLAAALEAVRAAALRGFAAGASVAGASVAGAPVAGAPVAGAPVAGAPELVAPPTVSRPRFRPLATHELAGRLDEELARAERSRSPLTLLRLELEDAERISAVDGAAWPGFRACEDAVLAELGGEHLLVGEDGGRAWVLAAGVDREGARSLAERIAGAILALPPWRGAPLRVAVGVAVLGDDADTRAGLIAAAEGARFAASAAGVAVGTTAQPRG